MKTSELIEVLKTQLQKNGDLEVFFNSGNDDSMWSAQEVEYHATEEDEFPRSWNMPESFLKILA